MAQEVCVSCASGKLVPVGQSVSQSVRTSGRAAGRQSECVSLSIGRSSEGEEKNEETTLVVVQIQRKEKTNRSRLALQTE